MNTNDKLSRLRERMLEGRKINVLIVGLGSVGNYLLTYLLNEQDERLAITVAGRNEDKLRTDANIATVASLIRGRCRTNVEVVGNVDLEDPSSVAACLKASDPDIIVNTSRVFSGLKYGSISWSNIRAYGIWAPLAVRYIRNIMDACEECGCGALIINTSYSDATIAWLKGAGKPFPDFGSGNINHIIPRLKMSAASMAGIEDFWDVEIDLATAHFHDVVISKEGHDEGVRQLLRVSYAGSELDLDYDELLARCAIPMPTDQKRNMMNASSNFSIIEEILGALRNESKGKFFSPGAFGEIGGYPVIIDGANTTPCAFIDDSVFGLDEMRSSNRASIALDGIEDVIGGKLIYTDELLGKAKGAFGVQLPKSVSIEDADEVADFLVKEVIKPKLAAMNH